VERGSPPLTPFSFALRPQAIDATRSFFRGWVSDLSIHSACTFRSPLRRNGRSPRPCLICAKTGSLSVGMSTDRRGRRQYFRSFRRQGRIAVVLHAPRRPLIFQAIGDLVHASVGSSEVGPTAPLPLSRLKDGDTVLSKHGDRRGVVFHAESGERAGS
jgi:hypothetical protein